MHSKINPILSWWITPKLPAVHLKDKTNFINKFFFHPLKRRIAKYYLLILRKFSSIEIIGITGSAGKTTTKEMLASILKLDGPTVYSKENIDPVYNIPSTILRANLKTKYLILEMGVEYPGEMDFYLWLAKPDVGIITNIFPTHTEFFGDIEGVFKEKSKLAKVLTENDTAVLNHGDKKLNSLAEILKSKIRWFEPNTDPIKENSNAAAETALSLGVSRKMIEEGVSRYANPPHRLQLIKHKSGAVILDDSYNSNPWAALATLKYFNKIAKGRKIAVLGDMLELGEYDEIGHRELGKEVSKSGFDTVIGVGISSKFILDEVKKGSKSTKTYLFADSSEAVQTVRGLLQKGNFVLVKGSRSIGLDKLVSSIS